MGGAQKLRLGAAQPVPNTMDDEARVMLEDSLDEPYSGRTYGTFGNGDGGDIRCNEQGDGRGSNSQNIIFGTADLLLQQRKVSQSKYFSWSWIMLIFILVTMGLFRWYGVGFTAIISIIGHSSGQLQQAPTTPQTLVPFVFQPLPLGSTKPQGWLRDQMQLSADGLAGNLHDFYHFVAESSWLGGNGEYSHLNEGFPYWFNGLVPLAYGLDDERLKGQIQQTIITVLNRTWADGWIGPENGGARNFWARYPLFLGMIQLVEADMSFRDLVLPALHKFVTLQNTMLKNNGQGYLQQPGDVLSPEDHGWGQVRVADMMITLQWLWENDPSANQTMLFENMNLLRRGALDWADWYQDGIYITDDFSLLPESRLAPIFPYAHGVNVGQGLKTGAVINRFEHNDTQITTSRKAVSLTFQWHGATSGTILADERLKGLGPYYGSELCTTVETMYSLSYLYSSLGDAEYADRTELAAFNALPVALTPDHWAHQYVTQPNQPYAKHLDETPFWNVNGWGPTYGLEPNYPCCTVNHPQGYPKFLSAMFVGVGSNGLAHALLSPGKVTTTLPSGAHVTVSCNTNYPFSNTLSYTITSDASFTFHVRIPSWYLESTSSLSLQAPGSASASSVQISPDAHSGLHALTLAAGQSTLTLTLDSAIKTEDRANKSIAITRGPILYALSIGFNITSEAIKAHDTTAPLDASHFAGGKIPNQVKDYEIFNTTPWNVAIDPSTLIFHSGYQSDSAAPGSGVLGDLPNPLFAPGAPPTWIEAQGCLIDWPVWKGVPGPVPIPDHSGNRQCLPGKPFAVKLVPYGSAKVHMAELPTVDLSSQNRTVGLGGGSKRRWVSGI